MSWGKREEAAIARLRSKVPPERVALADRVSKLHSHYLGLNRDDEVEEGLEGLLDSIAAHTPENAERPDKRRILVICGESGAGKSRAITHHLRNCSALQTYVDADGVPVRPLLAFDVPSECTLKRLAVEGLKALGFNTKGRNGKLDPWHQFRLSLKAHGVNVVLLDESQQLFETMNVLQRQAILNAIKHLVQMPDWPVRVILVGVPPLDHFLTEDHQIVNRMVPIPFDKLKGKEGRKTIKKQVAKIVTQHAGMQMASDLDDDFVDRLLHASADEFGTAVQTIRGAVELAMKAGSDAACLDDFADYYAKVSGCEPHLNIFECEGWEQVEHGKAFVREPTRTTKKRRKPKTVDLKFGERP